MIMRLSCTVFAASILLSGTHVASASTPTTRDLAAKARLSGEASYYADQFHGRQTASGELFDMRGLTAAHRQLAFGTRIRVTNLENGRAVVVRINDRGPYHGERVLDLSYGAARKLHMVKAGVVPIDIKILHKSAARR